MPAHRYAVVASALSADARQAVTAARQLRFDGMLFDAFGSELNIADLSSTGRREFRHVLSAQGRQLVGLRVDVGIKGFGTGADIDRLLSQFDKVLDAAADLGAPLVVAEIGPLPEPPAFAPPKLEVTPEQAGLILLPSFAPPPTPIAPSVPLDETFAAAVDGALSELGTRADRHSVIVALRSELSSQAALERALTSVRCPWFGVDLDPAGVLRDAWDLDETFSRLGPQVRHVRGRDAVKGADRRTKPAVIGRGDTPWDHLLANLDGSDFKGWITLDPTDLPDRTAAATSGVKYLRLHDSQ